jgi:long-chain fatty acid transport protein
MPINDKLSMGIGAFTNFGLKSQYSDSYNGSEFADTASVTTININPSIAYKLNDELSIGFGVNYLIASAEFATSLPESLGGSDLLSLEGDGNDIGWNAGIAWQASDATTVGFSYRTGFSVTLEGDASIPSSGINGADGELVLNLPSITDLSIAHNINEQLQVSASLTYTDWSTFETLEGDIAGVGIVPIKDEYYEGAYRVAVGGAYEYTPGVTLRAGLAYDESPVQAEYRSLSIPDSDRIWYSTGANFVINQQLDVDVAYTYVDGKEVAVVEESAVGSVFTGTSEGNANIVSMQLNVTF